MSRGDNWVKIDKSSAQEFKFINRPFSRIEALVSMTVDIDNGKEWSVAGYSKLWQWSRNKVRKFTSELRTDSGHTLDRSRTHFGHPIHLITKTLRPTMDRLGTDSGQTRDRLKDTTNKTKTKTKKKDTPPKVEEEINGIPYQEVINLLNSSANSKYRHKTEATRKLIKARFNDGFTIDDFKVVIESKCNEWKGDDKMKTYIRPETLFGGKFEGYLQACGMCSSENNCDSCRYKVVENCDCWQEGREDCKSFNMVKI